MCPAWPPLHTLYATPHKGSSPLACSRFLFRGSFLCSQLHPVGFLSSEAAWHQGARKSSPAHYLWSLPQKPPQHRIVSVFLSGLCHYFSIIAIFRSTWTKQKMWLVIWCCCNLLFECVEQQHRGFWVITVLRFWYSRHALLPFLWRFLELFILFGCFHIKWRRCGLDSLLCALGYCEKCWYPVILLLPVFSPFVYVLISVGLSLCFRL